MSLRARLQIAIVLLVTVLAGTLFAVYFYGVLRISFLSTQDRVHDTAGQLRSSILRRLNQRVAATAPLPQTIAESKALFSEILGSDPAIAAMLSETIGHWSLLVDAQVVGADGRILASSDAKLKGTRPRKLPAFDDWKSLSLPNKIHEIIRAQSEYTLSIPVGMEGSSEPVFSVVLNGSSVFLRKALEPELRQFVLVYLASLLGSALLGIFLPNVVLRPLERVSQSIERIAKGESPEPSAGRESKEFEDVQAKLSLLGQQFQGARQETSQWRSNIDQLLQKLEEAVLLFDPTGCLVMAGVPVERLLGRDRESLIGRGLDELFPVASPLGAVIREALLRQEALRDRVISLGDSRLLVNVELLEGLLGTVVTLRDAETRDQLQSQLDVSTRLTAIARLMGGVAHEIKNPLNAIALHLEVLKAKVGPEQEIGVIVGEIARLDRVVKTFLDFNRPVELRMNEVSLRELGLEMATLVEPEAKNKNVTVEFSASPASASIYGDADLLKQALLNVVMNGLDAMHDGGILRIEVQQGGNACALVVADEGEGIPPEVQARIFNLYFTTKSRGSGIGLAMTYRLVQLHNGSIEFESQPGKGTTFRLTFPAMAGVGRHVTVEQATAEQASDGVSSAL